MKRMSGKNWQTELMEKQARKDEIEGGKEDKQENYRTTATVTLDQRDLNKRYHATQEYIVFFVLCRGKSILPYCNNHKRRWCAVDGRSLMYCGLHKYEKELPEQLQVGH